MTQKKVEVIPATKRSVHNGGQLKVQSNIRVKASRLPTPHRKRFTQI